MARITKACPLFPAADVATAAEWYRDKLGFQITSLHQDDGYAIINRDRIELHFYKCDDRSIAKNTSAYFRVDGIDDAHATMSAARDGGRISEVENRSWGMREFYIWDPDGNLLRFGEKFESKYEKLNHLLDAFEQLPESERKRQIEEAEAAIREGRL